MDQPGGLPREVDARLPSNARVCDYALGGKDNFEVDRRLARRLSEAAPEVKRLFPEGHAFRRRALRALLDSGVRQFLDLGCGMPVRRNVHDIVHESAPGAAVVYVDLDPVTISHFQAILPVRNSPLAAVQADVRAPETILGHPEVTARIDFAEPVGVLMTGTLSLVRDEHDPEGITSAFRDALAPGGHLVLSDVTDDYRYKVPGSLPQKWMDEHFVIPVTLRSRDRIAGFFAGLDLLEPGLVSVPHWRPDGPYRTPTDLLAGGVGRKA